MRNKHIIILLTLSLFTLTFSSLSASSGSIEKKLGEPVRIEENQILIGKNVIYAYPLQAHSSYHIYLYGDWTKPGQAENLTDYDIYVYDPYGRLVSNHTEAAGLPEIVRMKDYEIPFFKPRYTGKYYFVIVNDDKESQSAKAATFMVIENVETNRWYHRYLMGKVNGKETPNTSWAYEFVSNSERIEVWIEVPETLDMYEARLYIMANPSKGVGTYLKGLPIPWEPGLYSETQKKDSVTFGGYNLSSKGYRNPDAFASCEDYGRDMLINYTNPFEGETLYYLVFIAERGEGIINFMVKTDFTSPNLTLVNTPEKSYPAKKTIILANASDLESGVERVILEYSIDNWKTHNASEMTPRLDGVFSESIPEQKAGVTIRYRVIAFDRAGNKVSQEGSYEVKERTDIHVSVSKGFIKGGESVTIKGLASNLSYKIKLTLNYSHQDKTITKTLETYPNGSFTDIFQPPIAGKWSISAIWRGDETHFGTLSNVENLYVEEIPTSLTCSINTDTITIGERIEISGKITPPLSSKIIDLEFTRPDESKLKLQAMTRSDGLFKTDYEPDKVGLWTVRARFTGDKIHRSSQSSTRSFTVKNTILGMIISWFMENLMIVGIAGAIASSIIGAVILLRRRRGSRKKEEWEEWEYLTET